MRLLPKPVYRYDLAAANGVRLDLVDGSAFAFVQGTEPEAVLLVEAVRRGDRETYQYGFDRASGWRVEAKLGPAVVWSARDQPGWNDPNLPGIVIGRRLAEWGAGPFKRRSTG